MSITTVEKIERFPADRPVAIVLGSSRGIGGAAAEALGKAGISVLGTHAHEQFNKRQSQVETRVHQSGGYMHSIVADMTKGVGHQALLETSRIVAPDGFDYIVINFAVGLEENADDAYAEKGNIAAPIRILEMFLPMMHRGGKALYVTSLWADRYGELEQPPGYEKRVARPKKITQQLLINRIPYLSSLGINLGFVRGHVIKDTGFYTIAQRKYPDLLEKLKLTAEDGDFATAADMGTAIRDMIIGGFETGDMMSVGGTEAYPYTGVQPAPFVLNRMQISENWLPMYGDDKLLIDLFVSHKDKNTGQARFDVMQRNVEGHFKEGYAGGIQVFRGVEILEAEVQTVGAIVRARDPNMIIVPAGEGKIPLFRKAQVAWDGMVFPGDQIIMDGEIISVEKNYVTAVCKAWIRGVGIISQSEVGFNLASPKVAQRLIKEQKALRDKYWD
ncbi:SDR family NAD(P)-dependent oxidoreductase [Candidatus Microgenomates bacterium]|nr:SDR family NAD(P)-dependent oxidoreductase [Candidatus Microgenomates bacterium]